VTTRTAVLVRYGLPDSPTFQMKMQQHPQQTLRVRVKHQGGSISMSTGHLSSLAHELRSVDIGLAEQIQAFLRSAKL
jgi:hypothetical protein